jgi:hypothetical protein
VTLPCLRSSAEERRASNPGHAEVRILSGALDQHDTVAERRGARLQSALTAVRIRPVSLKTTMNKGGSDEHDQDVR